MTIVHVYGASGYAAAEAIRLLRSHPHARLGRLESASHAGEAIGAHFPQLRTLDRRFDTAGSVLAEVRPGDAVILGGAHGTAKTIAPQLLAAGARVIDLSADYRLSPDAVYGFPERHRDAIAAASLVANPGCYPTATLLAVLPLAPLRPQQIVIDAKSGITGAGRTPSVGSLYAEVAGDVRAYGLGGHRHEPEIVAQLRSEAIGGGFVFTPHVVPLARGMLVDAYVTVAQPASTGDLRALFGSAYAENPFTRVLDGDAAPSVAAVAGTNDAEISVSAHGPIVRAICAIDNLGRGAAGSAIRNLNLMYGYPETAGLLSLEPVQAC